MKDLTAQEIYNIQDNITVAKNLIQLYKFNIPEPPDYKIEASKRVYDLLMDAEAFQLAAAQALEGLKDGYHISEVSFSP